jgi:hypothetical protein
MTFLSPNVINKLLILVARVRTSARRQDIVRILVVFLRPSRQILGEHLKTAQVFLPHHYKSSFTMILTFNAIPMVQRVELSLCFN